jgi:hypothetical protein
MTLRAVGLVGAVLALALQAAPAFAAPAASPFADWAAVIVAGDYHSHEGGTTEAFDNARRDVAKAFATAGFSRDHMAEFSVRPELYADTKPMKTDITAIGAELSRLAAEARSGCLIYFTSHGAPQGALMGDDIMTPNWAARMITGACGERPTVVVISACYSGVFVPLLEGTNRMVLTAARPDRSSFGCGDSDKYPYFDDCVLQSLPKTSDFPAMGRSAQLCVTAREQAEKLTPASEPQLSVGGEMRPILPLLAFAKP